LTKKLLLFSVLIVALFSVVVGSQKKTAAFSLVTVSPTPTLTLPLSIEDFPKFITTYLNRRNNPYTLEQLFRTRQLISDEAGGIEVRKSDTSDLVVYHLHFPSFETESLMIFALDKDGQVQDVFNSPTEVGVSFKLVPEVVVNFNHDPDIVYIETNCGAHTCYDRVDVIDGNGQGFVVLIDGQLQLPHPTYMIELGQITAVSGYVHSAGAGPQRAYTEIWQWTGQVITVTDKLVGPPIVRMHIVHDADAELERGKVSKAIELYTQAIDEEKLPGQFVEPSWDYKKEAAEALKLTQEHMLGVGVIDGNIPERDGGAHTNPEKMSTILKKHIKESLKELTEIDEDLLVDQRINKYANMGRFHVLD
jgi:hypothetical protein